MRSGLCYLGDVPIPNNWRERVLERTRAEWVNSKELIAKDEVLQSCIEYIDEDQTLNILGASSVDWHTDDLPHKAKYTTLLVLESDHTLVVKDKKSHIKVEPLYAGVVIRFNPKMEHRLDCSIKKKSNFYALSYDGHCLSYRSVLKHFKWVSC